MKKNKLLEIFTYLFLIIFLFDYFIILFLIIVGFYILKEYITTTSFNKSLKHKRTYSSKPSIECSKLDDTFKEKFILDFISEYKGQYYELQQHKKLDIIYYSRFNNEFTERKITIQGCFFRRNNNGYNGHFYIAAFCHLRNEFRTFSPLGMFQFTYNINKIGKGSQSFNQFVVEELVPFINNSRIQKEISNRLNFFISLNRDDKYPTYLKQL